MSAFDPGMAVVIVCFVIAITLVFVLLFELV
jgi:hypothetical protein